MRRSILLAGILVLAFAPRARSDAVRSPLRDLPLYVYGHEPPDDSPRLYRLSLLALRSPLEWQYVPAFFYFASELPIPEDMPGDEIPVCVMNVIGLGYGDLEAILEVEGIARDPFAPPEVRRWLAFATREMEGGVR